MCDCKKGMDGYCGACDDKFDGLFGYKISAEKKEKSAKTDDSEGETKEKAPKKKLDINKLAEQGEQAGGLIDSLLSGFRKKPPTPSPVATGPEPVATEEKTNWAMWIGLAAAAVVVIFIIWKTTRK